MLLAIQSMQMKGIMRGTYIFEGNVGYQVHAWDHRNLGYVISLSNGYRVIFSASGFLSLAKNSWE